MWAAVNITDSRAILRIDMGFYIGILLSLSMGSMSFWSTNNIDRSSHGTQYLRPGQETLAHEQLARRPQVSPHRGCPSLNAGSVGAPRITKLPIVGSPMFATAPYALLQMFILVERGPF